MNERMLVIIEVQCEPKDMLRKSTAVLDAVSKHEDLDVGEMKAHVAIREKADKIMEVFNDE